MEHQEVLSTTIPDLFQAYRAMRRADLVNDGSTPDKPALRASYEAAAKAAIAELAADLARRS